MKGRRILVLSLALAISLALYGVAQAAGLFATSVPYYHSEAITTAPGADYTIAEAFVGSPDGKVAVWDMEAHNNVGAVALDMGQQVCGPVYIYAKPPAPGASFWGVVGVSYNAPTASDYQPDAANYLYASDYDNANGRYTVNQQFLFDPASANPDNFLGLTSTPYTDSFQGVAILNGVFDETGYHGTPLEVDAVEGSPCASRTLKGFYPPVDMSTETSVVYNTAKSGSTIPLKFEIFDGETEITSLDAVKSLTYAQTACDASAASDPIEALASGGTILRYDTTAGQFLYNWQTPKTQGCYKVTVTAQAGPSLVAYFKLK